MTETEYKEVQIGPKRLEIPRSWKSEKFGDIFNRRSERAEEMEKYVGLKHLESGNTEIVGFDNDGLDRSSTRKFREGDILYGKLRPYLDKAAVAPFDGVCSSDIIPIFASEESTNEYLKYLIHHKIMRDRAVSTQKGTNLPRTSWDALSSTRIPVPPLPEQERIAEILSTVDEAIQQTDEIIETSKELKKGLMQDLLTKGIGHDEFKEVQLGPMNVEIAESWGVEKFGDIYEKRTESFDDEDQQINYVGLEHLESGKTKISGFKDNGAEKSSTRKFREGDILYGKLRPYLDKAAVAPFDGICSSDIIPIYAGERSTEEYLKYLIHHKILYNRAVSTQKGTNLPRTSWGALASAEIPVPPLGEQREIAEKLSTVDEKIREEEEYREKLEELKKGLMQDLLTGEVRVNGK